MLQVEYILVWRYQYLLKWYLGKNAMRSIYLSFLVLLVGIVNVSFAVDVSSCQVISSSGSYQLTADLTGAPSSVSGISIPTAFGSFSVTNACIVIASSDVLLDCNEHTLTNDATSNSAGMIINGSASVNYTNVTVRNCPGVSQYNIGVLPHKTADVEVDNVTAHGNSYFGFNAYYVDRSNFTNNKIINQTGVVAAGFRMDNGNYNRIEGNDIYNNSKYHGLLLYDGSTYNNITDNYAHDNLGTADFYIDDYSDNNRLVNNRAANGSSGYYIESNSANNVLINNTVYNVTTEGIYISGSCHNTTLINNTANETWRGIYADTSENLSLTGNEVYNAAIPGYANHAGIRFEDCSNVTMADNIVANGAETGIEALGTDINADNTIFYNNAYDFYTWSWSGSVPIVLNNALFLNPSGTFENYTNLSLNDTAQLNEEYYINWTDNPGTLPGSRISFNNTYVEISEVSSSVLDEVTWHWNEPATANESAFEIWDWNGSKWTVRNNTPDTAGNMLSLHSFSPDSTYALLEYSVSGKVINSSGTYYLTSDISGAGRSVSGVTGINWAAIIIQADDVILDCNGYNIVNDGTSLSAGIVIPQDGYSNLVIRNCPNINGYDYGIWGSNINTWSIDDSAVSGSSVAGLYVGSSTAVDVSNSEFNNNGGDGAQCEDSSDVDFENTNFNANDGNGLDLDNSDGTDVSGGEASSNGLNGISVTGGSGNTFDDVTASYNTIDGFAISGGTNNNDFTDCEASQNTGNGMSMDDSNAITVTRHAYFGNTLDGIEISNGCVDVVAQDGEASDNGGFGIDISDSDDVTVSNSIQNGNVEGGISSLRGTENIIDPSYFCNSTIGILLNATNDSVIEDSVACNNSQYGIYILDSDNITVNGTSRTYNNSMDLRVENNLGSSVTL
ncbi:hypothetical protein GF318_00005, partial [Candidatus Micrarchaeota archaeon]|nr:hypothetical protein [Candidatus Micrarchaeota archaeon]